MSEIKKCEFGVGSVVRLKSGGPLMTVVNVTVDERKCKVTWFSESKQGFQGSEFLVECVVKVAPDETV